MHDARKVDGNDSVSTKLIAEKLYELNVKQTYKTILERIGELETV